MPTIRIRQRQLALGRKSAYETALLFDGEDDCIVAPMIIDPKPLKEPVKTPTSPVSVASILDTPSAPDHPGEMQPLTLPGAWVVVGKGGRPVKNEKMYDEPADAAKTRTTTKKKKKARKPVEPQPLLVTLENEASSSKCLRELERSTGQRRKQVARAKDARYWAGYQNAKRLRLVALDELVAALALADGQDDVEAPLESPRPTPSETSTRRDHKANSSKDKARRRARAAAAAIRCEIWHDDDEPSVVLERAAANAAPSPATTRLMSGELQLVVGPRVAEPKPPGAWTTVDKRGKAVSDFPPLQPRDAKAAEPKRLATPTEPSSESKPRKPARKAASPEAAGNVIKCSVM